MADSLDMLDALAGGQAEQPDYAGHGFVEVQAETFVWLLQHGAILDRLRVELEELTPETAAYKD